MSSKALPKTSGTFYPDDPQLPSGEYEVGLVGGKFSNGDPATNTPPSRMPAQHINLLTDSIAEVITGYLGVIDNVDTSQLYRAIDKRVSDLTQGISPKGSVENWSELMTITGQADRDAYFVRFDDPLYPVESNPDKKGNSIYFWVASTSTWVLYYTITPNNWFKTTFEKTDNIYGSTDKAVYNYLSSQQAYVGYSRWTSEPLDVQSAHNIQIIQYSTRIFEVSPEVSGVFHCIVNYGSGGPGDIQIYLDDVRILVQHIENETVGMSFFQNLVAGQTLKFDATSGGAYLHSVSVIKVK